MQYAVIMAGGSGTRFWPVSRKNKPKQFLSLIDDRTMLQTTVERIQKLIPPERILIVTNADYSTLVSEQVPQIPQENIFGEPVGRNTAACIIMAAAVVRQNEENGVMVVLPSDHYIRDEEKFIETLRTAIKQAETSDTLITIGIKPERPETGYGYIQVDKQLETKGIHSVKTFAEKPDMETALMFLNSGDFLWNSGMFVWKASEIWKAFEKYLPVLFREGELFQRNLNADVELAISRFYDAAPSISIDYGVMEKASNVLVVTGDFGWSDVGSWLAIYEMEEKDTSGNVKKAQNVVFENTQNCYVHSNSNKMFALVGLQGIGIVETEDSLLICRLDKSQDVKKVVDQLDESNFSELK